MPKSDDRFYLMKLSGRPALYGDIGNLVRINGIIVGSDSDAMCLFLPDTMPDICCNDTDINFKELTVDEWSDFIQRTDDPEILVGPKPNGQGATIPKIFHRKLRYAISGAVQQKIWAADGFKCLYCAVPMGKTLLTIDHWRPLELGGDNNEFNFVTACKRCNKEKGNRDPEEFCKKRGLDFAVIEEYLKNRKLS